MVTAILATLLLLVPVGVTTAYLTSRATAGQTAGGLGRWCSVPNPAEQPNVYRLKDFPTYSSSSSSMIIVPVVRNGEFGSGGGDGRLGVRAWTCSSSTLTSNSTVKVTAWRNTDRSATLKWLAPVNGNGFPSRRLDPENGLGAQFKKLHRTGSNAAGTPNLTLSDRQRYTWLMSADRTKANPTAAASCGLLGCAIVRVGDGPTFANGFAADTPGSRIPSNSVEYLGAGYWKNADEYDTSTAHPVNLSSYGNDLTSSDGRQVQWVVMEWWGSTPPSDDMVLEVFVR